jgi:UDP-glucuronate 4-epimerase
VSSTKIVVTGGAGFIGSHVCEALLGQGHRVVAVDNFDPFYDRAVKEDGIKRLRDNALFELVEEDIRNTDHMAMAFSDASHVVHLAARAGVRPSIEQPQLYMSVNVEGTASVLEACRRAGVTRMIFGSSSSVYGDTTEVPFREDAAALKPISPYAASKRAGEHLCETFAHLYGLRIAGLRFFTVYGDRQRPDLAIHKFTRLVAAGKPIVRFGDGSTQRDYTYVDDIVGGVLGALSWLDRAPPGAEIFNLGGSKTVGLSYLIDLISGAVGREPVIRSQPDQPGDVRRTCADISKARSILGYVPAVEIEKGVPLFVDWYRETHGIGATTTG